MLVYYIDRNSANHYMHYHLHVSGRELKHYNSQITNLTNRLKYDRGTGLDVIKTCINILSQSPGIKGRIYFQLK